ncbi:MAG: hypothetical protein IJ774_09825 [Selenomonadaceae bacterium]|nr:hypothetical protein [Selenomonadaceae bacterium]
MVILATLMAAACLTFGALERWSERQRQTNWMQRHVAPSTRNFLNHCASNFDAGRVELVPCPVSLVS